MLEHDRVDSLLAVDALVEVLDARPVGEALVAERGEPCPNLRGELAVERQPLVARCRAEERMVSRKRRCSSSIGSGSLSTRRSTRRPRGRRSQRLARRRAARRTAARAGLRPPPGPRRDRRAAAPRAEAARSSRKSLRARPRCPPRPGCSPGRRRTGLCGPRPMSLDWRAREARGLGRARRRRRAGASSRASSALGQARDHLLRREPRREQLEPVRPVAGDSPTPASRPRRLRAPPRARPSRRPGTSTAPPRPTARRRGRTRRSSTWRQRG